MTGAMTYSLINAVRQNPDQTYGQLLESMNSAIERANGSGCFYGHLKKLFRNRIYQASFSNLCYFIFPISFFFANNLHLKHALMNMEFDYVCMQDPQLSSTEKFNIYTQKFKL